MCSLQIRIMQNIIITYTFFLGSSSDEEEEYEMEEERREAFDNFIQEGRRQRRKQFYSNRAMERMSMENIEADMLQSSCSEFCSKGCDNLLTNEQIRRQRTAYYSIKQGHRQVQYLVDKIMDCQMKEKGHVFYLIEGEQVCAKYFCKVVLCIGETTYKKAKKLAKQRVISLSKSQYNHIGASGGDALAFMENYIKSYGDPSPVDGKYLIPQGVTVRELYRKYRTIWEECNMERHLLIPCIRESQFHNIWRTKISHRVSFCSVGKVVKCSVCTSAKNFLQTSTDVEMKKAVKQELEEHLEKQM